MLRTGWNKKWIIGSVIFLFAIIALNGFFVYQFVIKGRVLGVKSAQMSAKDIASPVAQPAGSWSYGGYYPSAPSGQFGYPSAASTSQTVSAAPAPYAYPGGTYGVYGYVSPGLSPNSGHIPPPGYSGAGSYSGASPGYFGTIAPPVPPTTAYPYPGGAGPALSQP